MTPDQLAEAMERAVRYAAYVADERLVDLHNSGIAHGIGDAERVQAVAVADAATLREGAKAVREAVFDCDDHDARYYTLTLPAEETA